MPAIADLAAVPETVAEAIDEPTPDPTIEGATGQLSLNVGGHKVTASEFKLRGGSVAVEGQFAKGDRITLVVEAVVHRVEFQDKTDAAGEVTATTRRHIGTVEAVRRAEQ